MGIFTRKDLEVFDIPDFVDRTTAIREQLHPKLLELADDLTPDFNERLGCELFPHLAKHARRGSYPPFETFLALATVARRYRETAHFLIAISRGGVHTRVVVRSQANEKQLLADRLEEHARQLANNASILGALRDFLPWKGSGLPPLIHSADVEYWVLLGDNLKTKKNLGFDLGVAFNPKELSSLSQKRLLEALTGIAPLFRLTQQGYGAE